MFMITKKERQECKVLVEDAKLKNQNEAGDSGLSCPGPPGTNGSCKVEEEVLNIEDKCKLRSNVSRDQKVRVLVLNARSIVNMKTFIRHIGRKHTKIQYNILQYSRAKKYKYIYFIIAIL